MTKPGGDGMFREEAKDAAFGDVAVALSLLSGEVLHEVTHTLNFLRLFLQEPVSDADGEISRFAKAELERMQRMIGHLRRLKLPTPQLADVALSDLVRQSIEQVRASVAQGTLSIDAHIPADVVVRTDAECLRSAFRNLLLDALDRSPAKASILITADASGQQPLQLEFFDEGEALPTRDVAALDGWSAGLPTSSAFRRALAHRLLRHLGWSMNCERRAQRNVIRLTAPVPMSPSI